MKRFRQSTQAIVTTYTNDSDNPRISCVLLHIFVLINIEDFKLCIWHKYCLLCIGILLDYTKLCCKLPVKEYLTNFVLPFFLNS